MKNIAVIGINAPAQGYSGSGSYALAVTNYGDRRYAQMYAPVFVDRFAAEVFGELLERPECGEQTETPEGELVLAREVEAFIVDWDERQDGVNYPTPDGRYPKAPLMAQWFIESRAKQDSVSRQATADVAAAGRVYGDLSRALGKVFGL